MFCLPSRCRCLYFLCSSGTFLGLGLGSVPSRFTGLHLVGSLLPWGWGSICLPLIASLFSLFCCFVPTGFPAPGMVLQHCAPFLVWSAVVPLCDARLRVLLTMVLPLSIGLGVFGPPGLCGLSPVRMEPLPVWKALSCFCWYWSRWVPWHLSSLYLLLLWRVGFL